MIISKAKRNHIDITTLVVVLMLLVLSVGVVYSASARWALERLGESERLLGNHALKVFLGLAAMFVIMQVDYRIIKKFSKIFLLGTILVLLITIATGGEVNGAARWLRFGGFGIQPSEFARLALVFHLATLIALKRERVRDLTTGYLPMLFWTLLVSGLVLLQPAFSTGSMLIVVSVILMYLGGVRLSHLGLTAAAIAPVLAVYMVSKEYRLARVRDFIDSLTYGTIKMHHQVYQGILGFGNGGVFGLGPGGSKQREFYLPEAFGDFVYAIIGEEYGLIGTLFVLTLFTIFFLRGLKIARSARDEFGRALALGITVSITLYGLINAGVALGVLPTTGLPMPFVSYGGSSLLVSCIAVGVLLNISAQTDLHPRLAAEAGAVRPLEPRSSAAVGEVY